MACDGARVVAFLHGELSDADELAFDEHLLSCEPCWQAVREDRTGRLALEQLRVPAPSGLADRVALSIELAATQAGNVDRAGDLLRRRQGRAGGRHPERQRTRSRRRLVATVALVVAVLGGSLGWLFGHGGGPGDPPQIARVVAMLSPKAAGTAALRGGEQFDFGGQSLTVRSYEVEGILTLVATSSHPFPVPARADLVAGSSATAWMATHGKLAMYGVNHPAGRGTESMFLVAAMPVAQLPQVAARLHLL